MSYSYPGNRLESLQPGTRLGPTHEGVLLEVTEATYDETTDRTTIRTRALEIGDRTLRFVGGSDD
jgi:hypothetical protein